MEEVGFDKILEKLAQLKELRIVLVDALKICKADDVEVIRETCPSEFAWMGLLDTWISNDHWQRLRSWIFRGIYLRTFRAWHRFALDYRILGY